ncbi:unnamed protein product, partial [Ascophyllum nodosum]
AFRLVKRGSGTGGESVVSKTLVSWEPAVAHATAAAVMGNHCCKAQHGVSDNR